MERDNRRCRVFEKFSAYERLSMQARDLLNVNVKE